MIIALCTIMFHYHEQWYGDGESNRISLKRISVSSPQPTTCHQQWHVGKTLLQQKSHVLKWRFRLTYGIYTLHIMAV